MDDALKTTVDGFFPIQHCVYDWVRIQLYKRALEVGRPLLAVKTDALVFAGLEHEVKKEHTFAGIGRWGVSSEMTLTIFGSECLSAVCQFCISVMPHSIVCA